MLHDVKAKKIGDYGGYDRSGRCRLLTKTNMKSTKAAHVQDSALTRIDPNKARIPGMRTTRAAIFDGRLPGIINFGGERGQLSQSAITNWKKVRGVDLEKLSKIGLSRRRFYRKSPPRRKDDDKHLRSGAGHVPSGAEIVAASLFSSLKNDWDLSLGDLAVLLGQENDGAGREYVKNLLDRRCSFNGDEIKNRMARLVEIRIALFAIFENHKAGGKWLRAPQQMLDNQAPRDLLLEGSMKNLWTVQEFVEAAAGW